jgi:hypothetical protein
METLSGSKSGLVYTPLIPVIFGPEMLVIGK